MKTIFYLALSVLIGFGAFNRVKYEKSIADLRNGIRGESTASAKYEAFAVKAGEEGHTAIAKLFKAASKSESIHAANHIKALEALGEKNEKIAPSYEVKNSAENLQAAAGGEKYEITTMYPGFISDAKAEKAEKALKSFTWAMDTEKKHLEFYNNAIAALRDKKENTLPSGYAVCPVCGNTYDIAKADAKCSFCQTGKEKFINI